MAMWTTLLMALCSSSVVCKRVRNHGEAMFDNWIVDQNANQPIHPGEDKDETVEDKDLDIVDTPIHIPHGTEPDVPVDPDDDMDMGDADNSSVSEALAEEHAYPAACFAQTHEFHWFGKSPWCKAAPSDCKASGMDYVSSCKKCEGSSCWWGTKVQCKRTIKKGLKDQCDPMCSDDFERFWVGTAPWCEGSECGCISTGGVAFGSASSADPECTCEDKGACAKFGDGCRAGSKVLCLKPKVFSAEFNRAQMALKKECAEAQRINAHTKEVAIGAMVDMAITSIVGPPA